MEYIIDNIVSIINILFIKKTKLPLISILLFIITIILNSIQYATNNKDYLQNKIINSRFDYDKLKSTYLPNFILYCYDVIGVNAFLNYGLVYILYFVITYACLSLIELNIGRIPLLFLLFIIILFSRAYMINIVSGICKNVYFDYNSDIRNSKYCCGSQILFTSLGFICYIIQKNIIKIKYYILMLFIMLLILILIILYDYYTVFKKSELNEDTQMCYSFNWHASLFIFGIASGFCLSN